MTATNQSQPDPTLNGNQKTDLRHKRGRLTIFLGMAPGVGKTSAMLQSARGEKLGGRDVVIGAIETHACLETEKLANRLPRIQDRPLNLPGSPSAEMDLEALIARRPSLAVVDDLAHLNPPGSRNPRRYQEVNELLECGIDVYTTLNVHNVASRADTVRQITGVEIHEMVPDSVLDEADLELIDLAPNKLIKRFNRARFDVSGYADLIQADFFRRGNLTALREMALRLVVERAGQAVRHYMEARKIGGPWKSGHLLLAAVGPGGDSEIIVRATRNLAGGMNCPWMAVYVETPRHIPDSARASLRRNLSLAKELGAEVITTTDENVVHGLLRVASQRNATQIVVGKPANRPWSGWLSPRQRIVARLTDESGAIDIHVVRTREADSGKAPQPWLGLEKPPFNQYVAAASVILAVTIAAFGFTPLVGAHSTALIYLVTVVVLALFVGRGPTLLAATMSAILWDYFFLAPVFEFRIRHFEDAILFGMYFVVAVVLGQLTARIRTQHEAERDRENRATALYLLTRELTESEGREQMLRRIIERVERTFDARIAIFLPDSGNQLSSHVHSIASLPVDVADHRIAAWVFEQGRAAGAFTDHVPESRGLYLPLMTNSGAVGVLAMRLSQPFPPNLQQRHLLDAFCQQIALALDRIRLQAVSESAKLLAESERLSKTLLNSISHEIRTPIAAITSATSQLIEIDEPESQREMIAEIQEATERLNRLVENVLEITRLESGALKPKIMLCDVNDVVHMAVRDTKKRMADHGLTVTIAPELPLIPMDFVLIQQSLANLLANAAFHTPPGTEICATATVEGGVLVMAVADRGPGIDPQSLPRIFDKFYRAPNAAAGGTGLGLSLVRGFVEAHGGSVEAQNRPDSGAVFTIRLPLKNSPSVSTRKSL